MSENKRVKKNDVYTFLLLKQVCTMNIVLFFLNMLLHPFKLELNTTAFLDFLLVAIQKHQNKKPDFS